MGTENETEWPESFDEAQAIEDALADDEGGELEPVADDDPVVIDATGILSHILRTGIRDPKSGDHYVVDSSTFRTPFSDQYLVRLALYDRAGRRVYLSPFLDKGAAGPAKTIPHTFPVWDRSRIVKRSLVLWKSVNGGSVWTHWANG